MKTREEIEAQLDEREGWWADNPDGSGSIGEDGEQMGWIYALEWALDREEQR